MLTSQERDLPVGLRRRVERLEEELGVELLEPGTSGATPTAAGREVVEGAAALLTSASSLAERARGASDVARGVLRFIVPTGIPVPPRARASV